MDIKNILESFEKDSLKAGIKAAVKVSKAICLLFPLIKEVQPHIKSIITGMGTWTFDGHGVGICTEEEHKGEEYIIEDVHIADIITNGNADFYKFPINDALKAIPGLLDLLVGVNELNCSTWQDGFNKDGVMFYHSETSNQNNPFATPNKAYFLNSPYYKALVKAKVPVIFIDYDKIKGQ